MTHVGPLYFSLHDDDTVWLWDYKKTTHTRAYPQPARTLAYFLSTYAVKDGALIIALPDNTKECL